MLVLVVVIVVVAVAVFFLSRTLYLGMKIDDKAEQIAKTGRGIASSTDAVIQLDRTQGFGESILKTAQPLDAQVSRILSLAQSIDGLATSITASSVGIRSDVQGINTQATGILATANSINRGVEQINRSVDTTIGLARDIRGSTSNILGVERQINRNAVAINNKIPGLLEVVP